MASSTSEIELGHGEDALKADVYRPVGLLAEPRATVLFVHGMSLRGHRDARQVAVCRALAAAGLRVVAPLLPAVADARIDPASLARLRRAVTCVAADPTLCPAGHMGVFSASFSAGLSMVAATCPTTSRHISAVCAIGPYANLHTCLAWLLEHPDSDPYGRVVVFRSLLHRIFGPCPELEDALLAALQDDSLGGAPRLPGALARLSVLDRGVIERILHDPAWCGRIGRQLVEASSDLVETLDLLPRAGQVRCPVTLVHGEDDRVIPPGQSVELRDRIVQTGGLARLALTPLLSHGDQHWGAGAAGPAARLVAAFAGWMGELCGPAPRSAPGPGLAGAA